MPLWQVNAYQYPRPCWADVEGRHWRAQYYGDLFLQYGVALIGPGGEGPWSEGWVAPPYDPNTERIVETFVIGPETGDIILLRPGTVSSIDAVGLIVEGGPQGYCWRGEFNDVYGWELGHTRRVRWKACQHDFGRRVFFPVRFWPVQDAEVVAIANQLVQAPPQDWQNGPLPPLPPGPLHLPSIPCDP